MAQPPVFPLRSPRAEGRFRQVPPAIFPPILGLLALGLAWRKAALAFALPPALAEVLLGAATLLWVGAVVAYGAKLARRPGVLAEDVAILPGQTGASALGLCAAVMVIVLRPYAPGLAVAVMLAGLVWYGLVALLVIRALLRQPPEARLVTPVWHLSFTGFIVFALSALDLGWTGLARGLFWAMLVVALAIWGISLVQLIRRIPPAPLRPLLAIHLAPASLLGLVAFGLGQGAMASGFAVLGALILIGLVAAARWLTVAGFSPFWSAFTFAPAAYAGLLVDLGGPWRLPGGLLLVAVTLIVLPVAYKVMQAWMKGDLARRTNAAVA